MLNVTYLITTAVIVFARSHSKNTGTCMSDRGNRGGCGISILKASPSCNSLYAPLAGTSGTKPNAVVGCICICG